MVIYLYRYAINVTIFYQNISEDTLNTYWKFTSCGAIFISHIAVSYTHLDVYKRQNAGSLAGYLFPFIFAAIGISNICLLYTSLH